MRKRLIPLLLALFLAILSFSYAPATADAYMGKPIEPTYGWQASYFNNTTWEGAPALERTEEQLDYRWEGSPASGVNADFFSVRWQGSINVSVAGTLHLTATPDDRMRVIVNHEYEVIDTSTPGVIVRADTELTPGWHNITVEYVEYVGTALATLDMAFTEAPISSTDGDWYAQYFGNTNFAAPPNVAGFEDAIFNDWGTAAPKPSMPADFFSVRWTRTDILDTPTLYRFTVSADDAIRVIVDGQWLIDSRQPWTTESAEITLSPGQHTIIVEYVEYAAYAYANVNIDRLLVEQTPQPPQITRFAANTTWASYDEPVTLSWSVDNADAAFLYWQPPAHISLATHLVANDAQLPTGSYTLDLATLCDNDGQITLRLDALNSASNLRTSQQLTLNAPAFDWFFTQPEQNHPVTPCFPARGSAAAQQRFENGWMLWLDRTDTIYVFYDSDERGSQSYEKFSDSFDESSDAHGSDLTPPDGLQAPVRGFGKLWRGNERVRELLGWAVADEQGFTSTYQSHWHYQGIHLITRDYLTSIDGNLFQLGSGGYVGTWSLGSFEWR